MFEEAKKIYTIDGQQYTVARTSEWYNDETTITYWLYEGTVVKPGTQIGDISDPEIDEEADEEYEMPSLLAVKVALDSYNVRPLTPRDSAEWSVKKLERQTKYAERCLGWAKQEHLEAVKRVDNARERAEADVVRRASEILQSETKLAELRVKLAEAHVQLQNG